MKRGGRFNFWRDFITFFFPSIIFISLLFSYFKLAGPGSNTHAILMIFMDQKNMISMATAPGFEQISALKVLSLLEFVYCGYLINPGRDLDLVYKQTT